MKNIWNCIIFVSLISGAFIFSSLANASAEEGGSLDNLPISFIGQLAAKNQIVFAWSKDCVDCRSIFKKYVFQHWKNAHEGRSVGLTMLETETTDSAYFSEMARAVCNGKKFYSLYAWGWQFGKGATYEDVLGGLGSKYQEKACDPNSPGVRQKISLWSDTLSKSIAQSKMGSRLPVMTLNGKQIQPALLDQLTY